MHGNVPVRFGRGRLDSLGNKGLAAYLMRNLVAFDLSSQRARAIAAVATGQAQEVPTVEVSGLVPVCGPPLPGSTCRSRCHQR